MDIKNLTSENNLSENEFAIASGAIKIGKGKSSLKFTKIDNKTIEMNIRILLEDDYAESDDDVKGSIAVGKKENIKFDPFGKFTFGDEMLFEKDQTTFFNDLFLVTDIVRPGSTFQGVRLHSNKNDFDVKTIAIKIEHGEAIAKEGVAPNETN